MTQKKFVPVKKEVLFAAYKPIPPDVRSLKQRIQGISLRYAAAWASFAGLGALLILIWFHLAFLGILGQLAKGALYLVGGFWGWAKFHRTPESVKRLMDLPPVQTQFPVHIVSTNRVGVELSHDEGILTFCEGHLIFEGRRLSFDFDPWVLGKSAAKLASALREMKRSPRNGIPIHWSSDNAAGTVRILVFDEAGGVGKGFQERFRTELLAWCQSPPRPRDTITLPPPLSDDSLRSRFTRRRNLAFGIAASTGLLGIAYVVAIHPDLSLVVKICLFPLIPGYFVLWYRRRISDMKTADEGLMQTAQSPNPGRSSNNL